MNSNVQTKFKSALYTLLREEPFFAHYLLGQTVTWDDPKVPTAAVSVHNGNIRFTFNTIFFQDRSEEFVKDVIKHEVLHLLLHHLTKMGAAKVKDRHKWNIAMDICINQYLSHVSELEGSATVERLEAELGKSVERFQTARYYFEIMEESANKMQTVDVHADGDGDLDEAAKAAVGAAAERALKSAAGNVSEALSRILGDVLKPTLSWKNILRIFVANCTTSKTKKK